MPAMLYKGTHGELSDHAGYAALVLFGFLEAACIPISSEITFGFAGVLAYQGHLNLALVIILGTLAELVGSYVSYAVGRVGGRPLVHKLGRYVLITESDVARAERFLAGRGAWALPVGRMLPFVRAFASIVAGLVRIPAVRFGVLSLIGTAIYVAALSWIGYSLGSAWQSSTTASRSPATSWSPWSVMAIVGFVVYRLREFRREARPRRRRRAPPPAPPARRRPSRQLGPRPAAAHRPAQPSAGRRRLARDGPRAATSAAPSSDDQRQGRGRPVVGGEVGQAAPVTVAWRPGRR